MRKKYLAAAVALSAAAAASITLAAPAMAANSPATISRSVYLIQHPASSSPRASTDTRSINLAAGTYNVTVSISDGTTTADGSVGTRSLYLAAGTYNWVCYVDAQVRYQYTDGCSLQPTSFSGDIANMGSGLFDLPHSGTWTILGQLQLQ